MATLTLAFLSGFAFAISLHFLLLSATRNLKLQALAGEYSMRALRVERSYKIFAWSVLSIFFFITCVVMTARMLSQF